MLSSERSEWNERGLGTCVRHLRCRQILSATETLIPISVDNGTS